MTHRKTENQNNKTVMQICESMTSVIQKTSNQSTSMCVCLCANAISNKFVVMFIIIIMMDARVIYLFATSGYYIH